MGELVVGLDIGTTKVAALVGNVLDGGTIEIIGRGLAPSYGLEKGVVVDIGETTASIRRAVEQAEKMADVKIQSVTVGIAGKHIKSINNSGTVSINRDNRIITREDVRRVIETAQAVQIPPDSQLIHVIPRQYIVDGQDGITDPVGMTGMRLEVDVHIVTGAVTAVHNIVRCVQNMGIGIDHIVLQPLASSYAVLTSAEKELGVALMDIGGGTTDIAVFRGGDIWFSKILPIAGEHITNDITVGLKVPYEEAERIKTEEGTARVDEINSDERVEIVTIGEERKSIPRSRLAKIIEPRLEELFDMAMVEIEDAGYRDLIPGGIVLTGGTALLSGICEFVQSRYDIPARQGRTPQGIHGLRDIVESPIYATSVGLLKQAVNSREMGNTHWSRNGRRRVSVLTKIVRWLNRFLRG
jgi:cell division protein FtsA